jgi:hypothetical protein
MEKECLFCGAPLRPGIEADTCDLCQNDEGREMLAPKIDEGDLENYSFSAEE